MNHGEHVPSSHGMMIVIAFTLKLNWRQSLTQLVDHKKNDVINIFSFYLSQCISLFSPSFTFYLSNAFPSFSPSIFLLDSLFCLLSFCNVFCCFSFFPLSFYIDFCISLFFVQPSTSLYFHILSNITIIGYVFLCVSLS